MTQSIIISHFGISHLKKSKGVLILNEVRYTKSEFLKSFPKLIAGCEASAVVEMLTLKEADPISYRSTVSGIYADLLSKAEDQTYVPNIGGNFTSSLLGAISSTDQISIVVDGATGQEYIYDNENDILRTDLTPNSFWAHFSKKERKAFEENCPKPVARIVFDPNLPTLTKNSSGELCLNKYKVPSWRTRNDYQKPERFISFLKHLFNRDTQQMAYAIRWLYKLIYARNEVAIVFNGPKGTGKSLFATLCSSLVGPLFTEKAGVGFGRKEFNTFLQDKILVYVDEIAITKERYNSLKSYFDARQTVEGKGRDPINVRTHTNFVISHNSPNDFYVETAERRFSFMDITDTPLNEVWDQATLQQFAAELSDPDSELIKNIGLYVTAYGEANLDLIDPFEVYRGKTYSELVFFHLNSYMKTLIYCLEQDLYEEKELTLTHEDLRGNLKKACGVEARNISNYRGGTVAAMVKEYRYREKYILGEVINPQGDWHFKYNAELVELVRGEK